jgi:hypothetical protein
MFYERQNNKKIPGTLQSTFNNKFLFIFKFLNFRRNSSLTGIELKNLYLAIFFSLNI